MRDETVFAKEPTAAITTLRGMPWRCSDLAAHSIVRRDIFPPPPADTARVGSDSQVNMNMKIWSNSRFH